MDLGQYIKLHYTGEHPNDQDEDDDNKLPFKETQVQHVDLTDLPPLTIMAFFEGQSTMNSPANTGKPLPQTYSIFRPPQTV